MSKIKNNKIILPETLPTRVRLTKISDDIFNGKHPNGVNVGFKTEGILIQKPEVGLRCGVSYFRTSTVTEIIDKNTFKTRNSIYRIEYL